MISEADFRVIDIEVRNAINEILDRVRANNPSTYILFLADGEYKEAYTRIQPPLNPYVIDSREDRYDDETRLGFLVEFLRTFYTFPNGQNVVDNSHIRLNMELMIYTHIWEAKPFLKKLYRLAHLANREDYPWQVHIPPMGKHDFIRLQTRDVIAANGLALAQIIRNGYHSSLRNAFAHSEYSFNNQNNLIWLSNYNGDAWELQDITFDDWSRRFAYSILSNYHLLNIVHERRSRINDEFGSNRHVIPHFSSANVAQQVAIIYRPEHDAFNFER